MRFAIPDDPAPPLMGVRLLLDQLGVPLHLGMPEGNDLQVSIGPLPSGQAGISIEPRASGEGRAVLEYEGHRSEWPFRMDGASAAIRFQGRVLTLPSDALAYLCEVSCLRRFDLGFAQSYSWDGFRAALLAGLRRLADACGIPLLRAWHYPDASIDVAIGFSTDIDYLLQWVVLRDIAQGAGHAWMAWPGVAKRLAWVWNRVIASAYLSKYYFRRYWGPGWLHQLCRRVRAILPRRGFVSPLSALRRRGVPLTAFVRPSAFQKEEVLADPPRGTGRTGYRPHRLPGVEIALHFGATLDMGPDPWVSVESPYAVSPFAEGIPLQRQLLEEEVGEEVRGARLHNEWRFSPELFERIEAAGVDYDSTAFLGWIAHVAVRASPVGNCLPYSPVLRDGQSIRFARYVELPVSGYEHDLLPIDRLEKEGLPILVSQHPDSTGVNLPRLLLVGDHIGRWYVTYGELAHWWKERGRIRLQLSSGAVTVSDAPGRWCLAVYPPQPVSVAGFECLLSRDRAGERLYTLQSTSLVSQAAADASRTGVGAP